MSCTTGYVVDSPISTAPADSADQSFEESQVMKLFRKREEWGKRCAASEKFQLKNDKGKSYNFLNYVRILRLNVLNTGTRDCDGVLSQSI